MSIILKEENIASQIFFIRGEKIILDFHLAQLYGVETRALKQQVKRNIQRFPADFMFQLTEKEWDEVITNCDNLGSFKFSPSKPLAFTEQGVAMLSGILKSKRAVEVNIAIMRTFVQVRKLLLGNKELAAKIKELEKITSDKFTEHDKKIQLIFEAIRQLIGEKKKRRTPVGFQIMKK